MLLVVMGVAGAGKSTLGAAVSRALGWTLIEADDLHPPSSVEAMRAGRPLTDAERAPWLQAVAARMAQVEAGGGSAVVCCSALKAAYRERLRGAGRRVRFVALDLDPELARVRLAHRPGHFMPASLVQSQFATLEPPSPAEGALTLRAGDPLEANMARVLAFVGAADPISATPGSASTA